MAKTTADAMLEGEMAKLVGKWIAEHAHNAVVIGNEVAFYALGRKYVLTVELEGQQENGENGEAS